MIRYIIYKAVQNLKSIDFFNSIWIIRVETSKFFLTNMITYFRFYHFFNSFTQQIFQCLLNILHHLDVTLVQELTDYFSIAVIKPLNSPSISIILSLSFLIFYINTSMLTLLMLFRLAILLTFLLLRAALSCHC